MKKQVFENVKSYILDNLSLNDIKNYQKKWYYPLELVQNGFFACYYSDALDCLKSFYWIDFDPTRYYNKDGSYKYKNWQVYIRVIYCNMLAYVMNKLIKE